MSLKALTWALDLELPNEPVAKLLLLGLANYADEDNRCYPSLTTLQGVGCCSLSTVHRKLNWLVKNGYLTKAARFGPRRAQTSSLYTLKTGGETGVPAGPPRSKSPPPMAVEIPIGAGRPAVQIRPRPPGQADTPPGVSLTPPPCQSSDTPSSLNRQFNRKKRGGAHEAAVDNSAAASSLPSSAHSYRESAFLDIPPPDLDALARAKRVSAMKKLTGSLRAAPPRRNRVKAAGSNHRSGVESKNGTVRGQNDE